MRKIRTYRDVADAPAGAEIVDQVVAQRERLARRLGGVRRLVAVASGKGGVGKSAVTANLAAVLASRGWRVGALDADLNGPSLARMLGVSDASLVEEDGEEGPAPPEGAHGVRVVSMELLQEGEDAPLRWKEPTPQDAYMWRGALEAGALREFLSDIRWGELDVLLVDVPPGSDRISRLLELLPSPPGGPPLTVLLVTTPSEMARAVVARSVRLVRESGAGEPALVANMTAWVCPDCGSETHLFAADGEEVDAAGRLAREAGLVEWARIPFDPRLAASTDAGRPWAAEEPGSPAGRAFADLADRVAADLGDPPPAGRLSAGPADPPLAGPPEAP